MRMLPTQCRACGQFQLVSESRFEHGETACASCGSRARALPGESYDLGDIPLFNRLVTALNEAGIDSVKAVHLLAELGEHRGAGAQSRIRALGELMPALTSLDMIVAEHGYVGRKAEGMLLSLLHAMAARRRESGFTLTATGSTPKAARTNAS
jgi:hypothetical protein